MDLSSRLQKSAEEIKGRIHADGEKEATIGQLVTAPGFLSGTIPPTRKESELLGASVGWVYACAGVIADELANIRVRLYKNVGDGDVKEIEDHPALDIIHRANEFTTKFDHFWMTAQYLELTGEAPWFISFDAKKQPNKLLLLRPDAITVKRGTGEDLIGGYEYMVGGVKVQLDPKELVFLRYPDPERMFRGRGPLQAAARTVDLEEYSEEYNRRFFFNSGRPDGVLSTEQKLGRDQMTTLEKKLAQKYRGIENSHKTLILEKGLKWEPMALSQKDMEFLGQANFARDKILGIFRVPRTVLGITDDVNRANAEATDYVFVRRTIKPKMERIIQQLNEFLLPLFSGTEQMFYDFDDPVPEDKVQKLELQKAGLQYGWLTINEARAIDGYGPLEGGDELRVPISSVPLGEEGIPPELRSVVNRERLISLKARTRKADKEKKFRSHLETALAGEIGRMMSKNKKHVKKDVQEPQNTFEHDERAVGFQEKQLSIADEFESQFKNSVSDVFKAQMDYVLSLMPTKGVKQSPSEINWKQYLLLPEKEKERFKKELSSLISKLIIAQSTEAFAFIGLDQTFDANNPALNAYLEKRAFRFSRPVTLLTNRALARQFKAGISAGEGIPELRKRVESVFGKMERYRSERIARSETIRATNYTSVESWKQSGVVDAEQWITASDERVCEWCGPMNGKIIPLGDSWFNRGDSVQGTAGGALKLDYEKIEHPPLHTNCRCTLVPVVAKAMHADAGKGVDSLIDRLKKL